MQIIAPEKQVLGVINGLGNGVPTELVYALGGGLWTWYSKVFGVIKELEIAVPIELVHDAKWRMFLASWFMLLEVISGYNKL